MTGARIIDGSDLNFADLDGIETGQVRSAEIVTSADARTMTVGFTTLENVTIPRRAREEEVLYIISGSIAVEEDGFIREAFAGDAIFLSEGAAPTYHVAERTIILGVLSSAGARA